MEKREITGVQGQVNNIEVIFKEYYGSLCYFASRFLKDEEVIEDLVQDVFITLLEKKMFFQSEVHLKNFLYLSIRNSCLNYIRSTRSKDRYIASLAYEEQAENFEECIILTEIHRELAAAVEKLPEECRKVFQLCYFHSFNVKTFKILIFSGCTLNHKSKIVRPYLPLRLYHTMKPAKASRNGMTPKANKLSHGSIFRVTRRPLSMAWGRDVSMGNSP